MKNTIEIIIKKLVSNSTIDPETGCFEWNGCRSPIGYGYITYQYRSQLIHRLAYKIWKGEIRKNQVIMHSCDNPRCWNVKHLVQGSRSDNNKDMILKGRWANGNSVKTHCKHGHEFNKENTCTNSRGSRTCRICRRKQKKDKYHQRKASLAKSK